MFVGLLEIRQEIMVGFHFAGQEMELERGKRFREIIRGGFFGRIFGLREGGWIKMFRGVTPF